MTIQAGTEISLELMVGEFEEQACEHSQHGEPGTSHGGPATHYYQRNCHFCADTSFIGAVCQPFALRVLQDLPLRCPTCMVTGDASQIGKIVAPIS